MVQIVVEPIDHDAEDSIIETPQDHAAATVDYQVRVLYVGNPHIYMMANTHPGSAEESIVLPYTVSFVQLAAQTLLWRVDWTVGQWKTKPKIPNPNQDTDSNWVLMKKNYEPGMVTHNPDGETLFYRISGTYWYGHRNPTGDIIGYANFAAAPWLDNELPYVQDRTIDETMYTDNIINIKDVV